jgi:hypothetical protein
MWQMQSRLHVCIEDLWRIGGEVHMHCRRYAPSTIPSCEAETLADLERQARELYRSMSKSHVSARGVFVEPSSLGNRPLAHPPRDVSVEVAFPQHNSTVSWDIVGHSPHVIVVVGPTLPRDAQLCLKIRAFPVAEAVLEYACVDVSPGRFIVKSLAQSASSVAYERAAAEDSDERGIGLATGANCVVIKPIELAPLVTLSRKPKYVVTTVTLLVGGEPLVSTQAQFISEYSQARMVRSQFAARFVRYLSLSAAGRIRTLEAYRSSFGS